jgi:thiamine-phosphate pyrophosphorylase
MTSSSIDHLIEANISRFKEGARVLEDLARFVLKNEPLFAKIKALKHLVKPIHPYIEPNTDLGGVSFKESQTRHSLLALAIANGRRMQEAARVLEEVYDRAFYKKVRFQSYEIYTECIFLLKQFLNIEKLKGIYPICDPEKYSLDMMTNYINQNDISLCQIRMKSESKHTCIDAIKKMRSLLRANVLIIMNDHIDIALCYADGVHLGQNDLPLHEARKLAPPDFIIGITCHSVNETSSAIQSGASYIAMGALFPTTTKNDATPINIETLQEVVELSPIPVCAIGGINQSNIDVVRKTGVDMIAMQSGLFIKTSYYR